MSTKGVCAICGCSDLDACDVGCAWVNKEHTLCSACIELVELIATHLHRMPPPAQSTLAALQPGLNGLYWLARIEMHRRAHPRQRRRRKETNANDKREST